MFALLLIALLILVAAGAAMVSRNLIHSALLLVGAWAGIAAFYLWAGAEFLAFAQVLIYVGAVSMIVLFAVLLTRQGATAAPVEDESRKRAALALIVAGGVGGILVGAILSSPLGIHPSSTPPSVSVRQLGELLMGPHAPALLIVGVLLTVALLGAVVIAAIDRPENEPVHVRKPEDTS